MCRGDQQLVIDQRLCGRPDFSLDPAKVQHHALGIQFAGQLQIHQIGFANQPALGVQQGKIEIGELLDKQRGHGIASQVGAHSLAPTPARVNALVHYAPATPP